MYARKYVRIDARQNGKKMSEYLPKRMTSRWYVRNCNYVRIMDQGGDHSKKIISIPRNI